MKEKLKDFWYKISGVLVIAVFLLLMFGLPIAGVTKIVVDDIKKPSVKERIAVTQQITEKQTTKKPEPEKTTVVDYADSVVDYAYPGCPDVPEFGPGSAAYEEAKCWPGVDPYRDVYVSKSSLTVHDSPHCCGMKYFYIMQAYEAYNYGYRRCQVCW